MDSRTENFLKDFQKFSKESMHWCGKVSEQAIMRVSEIINMITTNIRRVSSLSDESVEVLQQMKDVVFCIGSKGDRKTANELAQSIQAKALENSEIQRFVGPVIESLQFQDRVNQNMDNMRKMADIWLEMRVTLVGKRTPLEDEFLRDFGQRLLKVTTMSEERDVVRSMIQGLPCEEVNVSALFF